MTAGEQGPQRRDSEASHAASLAQKLLCWAALACACDGGTDGPPVDPDDVDGDGIANDLDVCPGTRDPAQHDEDGDRIGDLCDVCPTVADPEQGDRGEVDANAFPDGVGDACDPRPSRGGDRIAALHTFATDTTPSWQGSGWTIDGDRVRATSATSAPARWQHRRAEQGDAVSARLAVEVVAFAAAGAWLSVALDGDGVQSGRTCTLFADRNGDGSGDGSSELEVRELGGAVAVRTVPGAAAGPFDLIILRGIDRLGGKVACRLVFADGRAPIEASITTIDTLTTGQYVMAAEVADVTVTSLVVYASPVACPTTTATTTAAAAAPAGLAACNHP
ncbi:MAG TPA: hypothetical protein VNO30_45260 [Kofleriaceae bacterium]|nr:hypothetical protein [Kofleriaceae bacterium]